MNLLRPKVRALFAVKGVTRTLRVDDGGATTITVRWPAWWLMPKSRKDGRPRSVVFPLWAIGGGSIRAACWWRLGVLVLDVPACNDPWQRRTAWHVRRGSFPRRKPHRLYFTRRQQPMWELCAAEIGTVTQVVPNAEGTDR